MRCSECGIRRTEHAAKRPLLRTPSSALQIFPSPALQSATTPPQSPAAIFRRPLFASHPKSFSLRPTGSTNPSQRPSVHPRTKPGHRAAIHNETRIKTPGIPASIQPATRASTKAQNSTPQFLTTQGKFKWALNLRKTVSVITHILPLLALPIDGRGGQTYLCSMHRELIFPVI